MPISPTPQEASAKVFWKRIAELTEENLALKAEIERLRAAAAGANAGAEERVARALQRWDFEDQDEADKVWNEDYEPDAYKQAYRLQARAAIEAMQAAGAAVRADETSAEKSADTPVT